MTKVSPFTLCGGSGTGLWWLSPLGFLKQFLLLSGDYSQKSLFQQVIQCFKVKRIQVKLGTSFSLQKHRRRAEHWIAVNGTAAIANGDQIFLLTENQGAYIPQGETHRFANPVKCC